MPVNCPNGWSGPCKGCHYLWGDDCLANPLCPVPMASILIDKEYTEYLISKAPIPQKPVDNKELAQLRAKVNQIESRLNEHLAKTIPKKQVKQKNYKGIKLDSQS